MSDHIKLIGIFSAPNPNLRAAADDPLIVIDLTNHKLIYAS